MLAIGVDVGGTKTAAVLITPAGEVLHRVWRVHAVRGPDALVAEILYAVDECRRAARSLGLPAPAVVGVGIASWLSTDRGTIVWAAHFRVRDFAIRDVLTERLGVPVVVDNDGNAHGIAEAAFGVGRGCASLMLVSLGTGVGGALLAGLSPWRGAHGFAAELGHVTVLEDGPECTCEAFGCLETFAGGWALAMIAATLPMPRQLANDQPVTAKHLVDAAKLGDAASQAALGDAGIAIAAALRRLLPAIDPEIVVLGGSIGMHASEFILPLVAQELDRMAPLQSVPQPRRIEVASLGGHSTAIGAGALALHAAGVLTAVAAPPSDGTR